MGLPLIFEVISNCCPKKKVQTSFMTTSGGSIMDNPLARQLEYRPKLIEKVEVEAYVFHDVFLLFATPPGQTMTTSEPTECLLEFEALKL